jgi:two-component system sensor histidine kinase KdpD
MAAGVGKTYAMLAEARTLLEDGVDLLVACLDTHNRGDTAAQALGLPIMPPLEKEYRGAKFQELDVEAILARRPTLVLVDELAHSNAPGSRHEKRYQDVFDLLDAGIDVFATVNIQHLESLAPTVERITGVKVGERLPDSVLERSTDIQLIDISPDDLRERLRQGKVYRGEMGRRALRQFFTGENLSVLRELALRQATLLAGRRVSDLRKAQGKAGGAETDNKILVALSPSPNSEYLIHWAKRLSLSLKAPWVALWVEDGRELRQADHERLVKHLALAKSMGAEVSTRGSADVVAAIQSFAREEGISILVVGKSGFGPMRLFRRSLTERLVRETGDISVIAVQERALQAHRAKRAPAKISKDKALQGMAGFAVVAAVTAMGFAARGVVGYWGVSILYLAAISLLGLKLERGPLIATAILSALAWDFLFISPRFTLSIGTVEDRLMLGLFAVLAFTSAWAMGSTRQREGLLRQRQERLSILSSLATELSGLRERAEILAAAREAIKKSFGLESIALAQNGDELSVVGEPPNQEALTERDQAAASYCLGHHCPAGRGTSTLGKSDWYFLPFQTRGGSLGVIGLFMKGQAPLSPDRENFLLTLIHTVALALEREAITDQAQRKAVNEESDRLGDILLNSVSHEMRSPLTVIRGSAEALQDPASADRPEMRNQLIAAIGESADTLNGIVENLLSMNRLESGRIRLKRSEVPVSDLFATALSRNRGILRGRVTQTVVPEGDIVLSCDEALMAQVLQNLVRNAVAYAGESAKIRLKAELTGNNALITVEDSGQGVPEDQLPRIFEKFYRGPGAQNGGVGLGLSICKGIVVLHGGSIRARQSDLGGLAVIIELPPRTAGREVT